MFRSSFLIAAAFFGLISAAQARIGDTLNQCITRYGKPVEFLSKGVLFIKANRKIYVTFTDGIADSVFFQKISPLSQKTVSPISLEEISVLLTENSQGYSWDHTSRLPDGDVIWVTKDSELGALYSKATCSLQVYTRENIAR